MNPSLYQAITIAEDLLIKTLEANATTETYECESFGEVLDALGHLHKAGQHASGAEDRAKKAALYSHLWKTIKKSYRHE